MEKLTLLDFSVLDLEKISLSRNKTLDNFRTKNKEMSSSGKTFEEYRKMLDENPYLQMPAPEEVKHIRDRYQHANKKEACWQPKWDLIHCITESDCVKVDGNRARDCLNRRQVRLAKLFPGMNSNRKSNVSES